MFALIKSTFKFKIIRYALVGTVCASTDLIIFLFLTKIVYLSWILASTLSTITATLFGYFLSITYVFNSGLKFNKYQEFSLIILIAFVSVILHQFLLYIFIELLFIDQFFSKVATIIILFAFNFLTRSKLVFK